MTRKTKLTYEVGYGKPPEHSRFKPGQSGNPNGRPKGSLNLAAALNRALKEKVVVVENGQRKSLTKLDVAIKGLVNRAVTGDAKAMQQMLALGPLVGIDTNTASTAMDANDAAVMADILARFGSGETSESS